MSHEIRFRFSLGEDPFESQALAEAIGNLAGWELQRLRPEHLDWTISFVEGPRGAHYFMLRVSPAGLGLHLQLDFDVKDVMTGLAKMSQQELEVALEAATAEGLVRRSLEPMIEDDTDRSEILDLKTLLWLGGGTGTR